ncbi:MAG: DUF3352 domain-containing protein, partial [Burkholderiales bacterium]|nr:DUF3352 domain-containing protein [Anaerolineae bacterium]
MKKLTLILMLAVVALGLLPATVVMATPVDELTALAAYYPASTVAFAGLRVDDAYIATLDDLIAELDGKLPDEMMAPFSFQSQLNDFASQVSGGEGDFDTEVRSWLGDTAAVGLIDLDAIDETPHYLIVLSVTDAIPAEELIGTITDFTDFGQAEEGEDYILWEAGDGMSGGGSILLADDVLLIAQDTETVMAAYELNGDGTLAGSDDFDAALALLPETDYNIVAYLANPLELFTTLGQMGQMRGGVFSRGADMSDMTLPPEIIEAVGPQVGFERAQQRRAIHLVLAGAGDVVLRDGVER